MSKEKSGLYLWTEEQYIISEGSDNLKPISFWVGVAPRGKDPLTFTIPPFISYCVPCTHLILSVSSQ